MSPGFVECPSRIVESTERDEGPRSTEVAVRVTGSFGDEQVVLTKRFGRVTATKGQCREPDPVLESMRIGHEAALVGNLGAREVPETDSDEPERVPDLGGARVAPERLFETGPSELCLAPAGSAEAALPGAGRIARRDFGGPVVKGERIIVLMSDLERVSELDPRDRARRTKPRREHRRLRTRLSEVPHRGLEPNEEPAFRDRFGMLCQVGIEHGDGILVPPLLRHDDRILYRRRFGGTGGQDRHRRHRGPAADATPAARDLTGGGGNGTEHPVRHYD